MSKLFSSDFYYYYYICSTLQSEVIPIESIVEKCILMDMTSELGFVFVSQFPNRVEVE